MSITLWTLGVEGLGVGVGCGGVLQAPAWPQQLGERMWVTFPAVF